MRKRSRIVKREGREFRKEAEPGIEKQTSIQKVETEIKPPDIEVKKPVAGDKPVAEDKPASSQGKTLGKVEILSGFALIGLVVGFLVGYGNLNPVMGVLYGIFGLLIGALIGYFPYLDIKKK